ncbi:hypothetical protein CFIMG_000266RA [Ceratocystis fimbriata CBS 114723]|uniref:Uncharacterized protein n=1 Tax=Ceratocystis fimbriata CBS 114723 TaxID=1035309 RepID=A0A2C5X412_9PEZI|nr:hypothetical protein CFIMG_000266RA [Ceratocystis fimbriata CBS 114723]
MNNHGYYAFSSANANVSGNASANYNNDITQPTSSSALNRILHPHPQPPVPQYSGPVFNSEPEEVPPNPFTHTQYLYPAPLSFTPHVADEDDHTYQTQNGEIASEDEPHRRRPEKRKTGEWQKMAYHRERAAKILQDPELLFMYSESRQESLAGTRLHYMRLAAGYSVDGNL